jgi:hypothetical protein
MNIILPTNSQENEENKPPPFLATHHYRGGVDKKRGSLGERYSMSRRSSVDETDGSINGHRRNNHHALVIDDEGGGNSSNYYEPSPTTLHRNLEDQGVVGLFINSSNGINDDNNSHRDNSPSREGLHRRKHIYSPERGYSPDRISTSRSLDSIGLQEWWRRWGLLLLSSYS